MQFYMTQGCYIEGRQISLPTHGDLSYIWLGFGRGFRIHRTGARKVYYDRQSSSLLIWCSFGAYIFRVISQRLISSLQPLKCRVTNTDMSCCIYIGPFDFWLLIKPKIVPLIASRHHEPQHQRAPERRQLKGGLRLSALTWLRETRVNGKEEYS